MMAGLELVQEILRSKAKSAIVIEDLKDWITFYM